MFLALIRAFLQNATLFSLPNFQPQFVCNNFPFSNCTRKVPFISSPLLMFMHLMQLWRRITYTISCQLQNQVCQAPLVTSHERDSLFLSSSKQPCGAPVASWINLSWTDDQNCTHYSRWAFTVLIYISMGLMLFISSGGLLMPVLICALSIATLPW